jgi:HNH endonuclease/RuvA, C-terminal domain
MVDRILTIEQEAVVLREADVEIEEQGSWMGGTAGLAGRDRDVSGDWRAVDRALRAIAKRRAGLDADEARWLREAEVLQIWHPLGMVSALDYMERVLGYSPRTAQDRLRVARALGALPELTNALVHGELAFSAIRELTRVATPATEAAWRAAAHGKNLRQIELLVADHRPGDRPDDPPDPEVRTHVVRFELSAETFALLRQTRSVLDNEHDHHLEDDELVAALCGAMLDGKPLAEPLGRGAFQIAVTVCERCKQGWQDGAGRTIPIGPAAVERAMCDAQHLGSLDGDGPQRAYQDIPPSVARFVWRRDHGCCRVPGCRSSRGLQNHHLVHRADGGNHDASNLILLCSACHRALHQGRLTITGTADGISVRRAGQPIAPTGTHVGAPGAMSSAADEPEHAAHVGAPRKHGVVADGTGESGATSGVPNASCHASAPSKLDQAIVYTQTKQALLQLGWKPNIAQAAVAAAAAALGDEPTLEQLVVEALRRCPRPCVSPRPPPEARGS